MAKEQQRIVVTATSALTALGADSRHTLAAIDAGMVPFREHEYYDCLPEDPDWDERLPLYAAIVPTLPILDDNQDRLTGIAIPTLANLFAQAKFNRSALDTIGLYLALPQRDSMIASLKLETQWLPELLRRVGLARIKHTHMEFKGQAGFFFQLHKAKQQLQSGTVTTCVVGGIDSYLLRQRVKLYDEGWRIKSERNPDGFVPGEGACLFLLETEAHAKARGITPLAVIDEIAFGNEINTLSTMKNSTGQGLTSAIDKVMEDSTLTQKLDAVYTCLNGENYFAFEWGLILTRLGHHFHGHEALYHPADCCGDMGAALSAVATLCAVHDMAKTDDEKNHLVWCSSDIPDRAALILKSV